MDRLIASNTVAVGSGDTAPATGTPGQATSGNPATNTPATVFPAYAWNAVQEELIAILVAAGITPDRTNNAQIAAAIKRIGQNTVVLADTGSVNAYTATNATPLVAGTWVDGVVQAVKIAHTNTGASTYAPDGLTAIPIYGLGLQPLQGSELFLNGTAILMRATIAGVNSGNPICVLMECAGGAQQIPAATQPLHAAQYGQVNAGRLLNVQVFAASGTYTPTSGMSKAIVQVVSGGAGSGGAPTAASGQISGSGGSASGTYAEVLLTAAQIGASQAVTIGAAGAAGASGSSTGGTGGVSSFGSLISCPGGLGSSSFGPTSTTFQISPGGTLGAIPTISAGTILAQNRGNAGGFAVGGSSGGVIGGPGGASPLESGTGAGTGANGVGLSNASAIAGLAGTAGKIIVYEYA